MSDDKNKPDQDESPEQKATPDNVIRFPVERVKSKRKLKKLAGKMNDNKKATLFLSLLSVMVMSAYLLQNLGQETGRFVASGDSRDMSKEKELAEQLMNPDKRTPASYGRKPSAEDQLKRVDLNGRYHMTVVENVGMEIKLMEGRQPIQFSDLDRKYSDGIQGFILAYGDFFQPHYNEVRAAVDTEEAVLTAHHFELLNDDAVVGRMRFELNQFGELLSIKVQAIQKP